MTAEPATPLETLDVLCFATQGADSGDARRVAYLLDPLRPRALAVDRACRTRLPLKLLRAMQGRRPDVVVMEGTGFAGGLGVMAGKLLFRVPYIVSSGDAVAPFLRAFHPRAGPVAPLYERALYRFSAGFIGWSPYLVGRALQFGAPRAMTAAHYSRIRPGEGSREATRAELGIPSDAIVIGIVGRILTDPRQGYSYGFELIQALRQTDRGDLRVLIVGGGSGHPSLIELAGEELGRRVLLPGHCPPEKVPDYLAAMDIGVLAQSTDLVGAMRYTTKLPEYLAAGLPVLSLETPLSYDLDTGWLWRLPGDSPWEESHIGALAAFMRSVSREEVARRRTNVPRALDFFDPERQQQRASAFVREATARAVLRKSAPRRNTRQI